LINPVTNYNALLRDSKYPSWLRSGRYARHARAGRGLRRPAPANGDDGQGQRQDAIGGPHEQERLARVGRPPPEQVDKPDEQGADGTMSDPRRGDPRRPCVQATGECRQSRRKDDRSCQNHDSDITEPDEEPCCGTCDPSACRTGDEDPGDPPSPRFSGRVLQRDHRHRIGHGAGNFTAQQR
jgi:hypothetical protein